MLRIKSRIEDYRKDAKA